MSHTFGIPAESVYCDKCKKEIAPNSSLDLCEECLEKGCKDSETASSSSQAK